MTRMPINRLLIAISSLSCFMSSISYAAYPTIVEPAAPIKTSNFYVGGDFGWGKVTTAHGVATEQPWVQNGVLVNAAQVGNTTILNRANQTGISGGVTVGYNFNRFLALELGGDGWEQADYKWRVRNTSDEQIGNGTGHQRAYDIHLLAKIAYPFENGFVVYAKGGGAYVRSFTDISSSLNNFAPYTRSQAEGVRNKLRPEAAVGLGYNVDEHWSIHGQYAYIWGENNNPLKGNFMADLQQATVGVQYNIL